VLPVVLAEPDRTTGLRRSMVIQSIACGSGARQGSDGVDGRESGLSNTRNSPIERTEDEAGVMVEEYALRSDSGGAGRWRGGTGVVYTIRILKDDCAVLARGLERFFFTPWGAAGGKAAAPCRVVLNIGRANQRDITRVDMLEMKRGDTISLMTPGGGGFGDPFTRPYDEVLHDVERGFVSEEAALRDYGVAVRDGAVDEATSAKLRRAARPAPAEFDFGPNRVSWESVFVDDLVTRLNVALKRLPASVRGKHRRTIYEAVMPDLKNPEGFEPAAMLERAETMRAHFAELVAELESGEALR
jgi:N-methylhydantoinase B